VQQSQPHHSQTSLWGIEHSHHKPGCRAPNWSATN